MTNRTQGLIGAAIFTVLVWGCSKEPDPNDPSQVQGQYPQGQYGQQYPQQGYPQQQQPGYPQQQPGYPPQQGAPTATAPASPFALPCQADSGCGTHKCNLAAGRCQVPCASAADCMAGAGCAMGVCLPGVPAQ